jgi:hypothetical protein
MPGEARVRQVLTFPDNRPIIKTLHRVDVVFIQRMIPWPVPPFVDLFKGG